jgi:hypothetical protein
MYSDSDLEAAVAAGALTPDAAAALRDFVDSNRATPVVDEEHFRLLTGFNDIFVGLAAAILLFALAYIGQIIGPNVDYEGPSPSSGILVAGAAWGLAEFFTRKRRMALPSILLLLAFVGGVFEAVGTTLIIAIGEETLEGMDSAPGILLAVSGAAAVAAAWFHWRRFRVPITVAAGAAALCASVLGIVGATVGDTMDEQRMETIMMSLALVLGIGVFLFAMRWDSSDPRRETRRSDVAFWLHLLAAPLIVHPIFSLLGLTDGDATVAEALIVILVYVMFGLTALAIDRRALLVSALAYVLWALSDLFERIGAVELSVALTAFVIGSALLLLSAFWHNARRMVVRPLPPALQAKLPVLDRPSGVAMPA